MTADTLAALFAEPPMGPSAEMRYRTGTILTWDPLTAENTVQVDSTVMTNLAILNSGEIRQLGNGARVAILCAKYPSGLSSFTIVGRIIRPGTAETSQIIDAFTAADFQASFVDDYVATLETVSSLSFDDLDTFGPTVTVTVGPSGRILVLFGAQIGATEDGVIMSFELTGANTLAPSSTNAFYVRAAAPTGASLQMQGANVIGLDGLTPGDTTITCKYAGVTGSGTAAIQRRRLTVITL